MVDHWGLEKCKERLNDPTITQFIRQCPCCQVMSPLKILIKTHPFTCASYNPFESIHIDHIGPLLSDDKGNTHILVMMHSLGGSNSSPRASSSTSVDSEHPTSYTLTRVLLSSRNFSQSYRGCQSFPWVRQPASCEARSAVQGSDNPGADTPHASRQG